MTVNIDILINTSRKKLATVTVLQKASCNVIGHHVSKIPQALGNIDIYVNITPRT